VLAFIARRLESDQIVLLSAVRDGFKSALLEVGLPELRLEGLDHATAAVLLDARAPGLSPTVRERLLSEAAGNPLALIELPAALQSAGIAGNARLPEWLPLTWRLERALAARVSELPEVTRKLLLVAAVDESGVLSEILEATTKIIGHQVTTEAVVPADSAGLVKVGQTDLSFRHPLIRSAIYQAASLSERQAAHAGMAAVLTSEPDRRAWHRAASIVGFNEEVASEVEEMGRRAQLRGGNLVAVAALERAAQLSADPARRGRRLLRAAELAFDLGRPDIVLPLSQEAEWLELTPLERGRMTWIREMIDPRSLGDVARVHSLLDAADRAREEADTHLALNLLMLAAARCWWTDPGKEVRDSIVAAAERAGSLESDARLVLILAFSAPFERGRVVIENLAHAASDRGRNALSSGLLGAAATMIGVFDIAARFNSDSVAGLRAQGRLNTLVRVLFHHAWSAFNLADWTVAIAAAEEASRLAEETRQPTLAAGAQVVQSMLAAMRGETDVAEVLATEAERTVRPRGVGFMLALVQMARGLASLSGGRHDEAYGHLIRLFEHADPAYHPFVCGWGMADLAEAAVPSGNREAARALLAELQPIADQAPSTWLHLAVQYARPLLADNEDAEPLFKSAFGAGMSRWPLYWARLQLAFGMWLRRQRRVGESRVSLRAARDAFDALGAVPWGERARQELRAAGEMSRRPTPSALDHLSPQELQVALMAAEGMTNRQIGQQLYLSHRTVSTHLYRIFQKLEITARSQLRNALNAQTVSPH
jgi:DNA-binding CsgD family transcriptional regulator/tetratricopeptide (TPR) repeat protein